MMLLLVSVVLTVCTTFNRAEQVPCQTDKVSCETAESQSVVNNRFFCCEAGFSMLWLRSNTSLQMECFCDRFYHATDCLVGRALCQGATSMTSDGLTVKCCKNGAKLTSVSNSLYNGVMQNYCTCTQYTNVVEVAASKQAARNTMTALEEMQMYAAMGLLPEEMTASLNQMANARNPVTSAPGGFGQWATSFVEGLMQGVVKALGAPNNATSTNGRPGTRRRQRNFNLNNNIQSFNGIMNQQPLPALPMQNLQAPRQIQGRPSNSMTYSRFSGPQNNQAAPTSGSISVWSLNPYSRIRPAPLSNTRAASYRNTGPSPGHLKSRSKVFREQYDRQGAGLRAKQLRSSPIVARFLCSGRVKFHFCRDNNVI
ncbi:hypothetical protein Btru_047964 [Bulinus truncatus]|nr:hypothetical protein Btru_047964 [Bulinus truncatus]